MRFFRRILAGMWILIVARICGAEISVMTFNLWHGGDAGGQPVRQSAEVIRRAGADVIGLQETRGISNDGSKPDRAKELAEQLGFHYFDQGDHRGIISRFPIVHSTPDKSGVEFRWSADRTAWIFNVHLAHSPYQPYQLLGIPYGDGRFLKTEAEAIQAAKDSRGAQIEKVLSELKPKLKFGAIVFLTGDFNEPSHLDWTEMAFKAKQCPIAVDWPSTRAVLAAGMKDSFRMVFPDPVKKTGFTWTPITRSDDPKDRHDRIDFVFFGVGKLVLKGSKVVGENRANADLVVEPYPSDHRAVVSQFDIHE